MPPVVPPVPVTTKATGDNSASGLSQVWLNWFQTMRRKVNTTDGPYTNDAAAATAGVQIGQPYYQPSGAVVVRLT